MAVTQRSAPVAKIEGPILGTPLLSICDFDLSAHGIAVEEYFVSGTAASYRQNDGGIEPQETEDYRTRIVLYRPATFSGSVPAWH
jgi:Alpha/beta hydrolase domain